MKEARKAFQAWSDVCVKGCPSISPTHASRTFGSRGFPKMNPISFKYKVTIDAGVKVQQGHVMINAKFITTACIYLIPLTIIM